MRGNTTSALARAGHLLPLTLVSMLVLSPGCDRGRARATAGDSAFAAVQRRGAAVMGVDQYTSHHVFDDLPDGGRILLARDDPRDTIAVAIIQAHFRAIADSFARGVFTDPSLVHAREVPGTTVMARLKDRIRYNVEALPDGGALRITSSDSAAVTAIHEFLAFQRMDHHAMGHEM